MPHIHDLKDFTASAFVLHPTQPKILLLKHVKIGKWLQPGGHVELHENPLQTLHHELEEETGLRPDNWKFLDQPDAPKTTGNNQILPLPFYFNEHPMGGMPDHHHVDLSYLVRAKTEKLTNKPDGASKIGWYTLDEIKQFHQSGDMYTDTFEICSWIAAKYFL